MIAQSRVKLEKKVEQELETREESEPAAVGEARFAQWEQVRAIRRTDLKAMELATEAQQKYIRHLGGEVKEALTKNEASEFIPRLQLSKRSRSSLRPKFSHLATSW